MQQLPMESWIAGELNWAAGWCTPPAIKIYYAYVAFIPF